MKNYKVLPCISALLVLTACGGGGGGSSSKASFDPEPTENTGVFLDSPVVNIGYRTETLDGVTNSLGQYKYITGETVTFFIGDLQFPAVKAKDVITPLDLANTQSVSDSTVVNMIRLLQTLDKDGNVSNGITITDAAKAAATQVDFKLSNFESSAAVTNLILNAGQDSSLSELISSEDALAHFVQALKDNGIKADGNSDLLNQNTYYQVFLDAPETYSALSKVSFNAGTASFEELFTSSSDPLESGGVSYTVASDGRTTIDGLNTAASNSDGSIIVNVDAQYSDGYIGMSLFTKIDSGATQSSINGKYYCASLDSEPYSVFFEATFGGNGSGSYSIIEDSVGGSGSENFTYSISEGMLIIVGTESISRGGIASNGDLLTLVQSTDGFDPGITACVKSSSGMSSSSISGKYYGGFFDSEPYTAFSSMNFNGSGNIVASELNISSGTAETNQSLVYSVQNDGRINIAGSVVGAVSPDGNVIIYTNTDSENDLSLGVLIKSE